MITTLFHACIMSYFILSLSKEMTKDQPNWKLLFHLIERLSGYRQSTLSVLSVFLFNYMAKQKASSASVHSYILWQELTL